MKSPSAMHPAMTPASVHDALEERMNLTGYTCVGLVPLRMKWACSCCGNGNVIHLRLRVSPCKLAPLRRNVDSSLSGETHQANQGTMSGWSVLGVAGLGFLPIPEQIMLRQLLVREGTQSSRWNDGQ